MPEKLKIKRCTRCRLPASQQFFGDDDLGICKACRSSEQKMRIDWSSREKKLKEILELYKKKSENNYDCIVPISGGKDSAYQLYVIKKIYKMNPLAVTFSHNWFTKIGRENLKNLTERLSVDLIEFTPNRNLVNNLARESIEKIGDSCWHCHMGVDAFPLHIAVKFKIPLLIFGESVAESGKETYLDNPDYSVDYFLKYSSIVTPDKMVGKSISKKDLNLFNWPNTEDLKKVGVNRIHLADFIYWDAERQTEFVRDFLGWKEADVEGTYKKYKSVECIMPGVHDYSKFLKRGFGRGTDFSSLDLRDGLMDTNEARNISLLHDSSKPKILEYFLKITNLDEKKFNNFIKNVRDSNHEESLKNLEKLTKNRNLPVNSFVENKAKDASNEILWQKKINEINDDFIFPKFNRKNNLKPKLKIKKFNIKKNVEKKYVKYLFMSAIEQNKFLKNNKSLFLDLIKYQSNYIKDLDKKLKAWSFFDPNLLMDKAEIINKKLENKDDSNFKNSFGILVAVKDIFNTMDMPTTMGSEAWKNYDSGFDARIIHTLRTKEFLIAGKTQTAEFAVDHQNKTKYIFDDKLYGGTSSSGSAAVVSSRMSPIALASQTAGSTIRPSSYHGIFGFKPSFGTIPRTGILKTSDTLDSISLMTSHFDDIKYFFNHIRVKGHNYPFASLVDNNEKKFSKNKKFKLLIVNCKNIEINIDKEVKSNFKQLIQKLKKIGHDVDERDTSTPDFLNNIHRHHDKIYSKSLSYHFENEIKNNWNKIKSLTKKRIGAGTKISNKEYEESLEYQIEVSKKTNELFKKYDFILCPSTAGYALKSISDEKDDYCLIWTFLGLPAINIPSFVSKDGFPFGLQIVSQKYNDLNLINFCDDLISKKIIKGKAIRPEFLNNYFNNKI